ncbi:MAG: AraC family transcriptional regulator [Planctomycetota bacterium]
MANPVPPGYHRFVNAQFEPPVEIAPAVLVAVQHQRAASVRPLFQRLRASNWVINYAPETGLRVRQGDGPWWIRPARQCHCYAPGTVYWEDWEPVAGRRFGGSYLIVRDVPGGALERLLGNAPARFVDHPQGRIEAVLATAFSDGAPTFWEAQAALATLLSLVAAAQPHADAPHRLDDRPIKPSLTQRVDTLLRRNLAARHSLASLANQLGLSSSALSHRYVAETGNTPMTRLARLRVELAQALLLTGTTMADAAQAAGFCDQFHCSRVFRRIVGVPPSTFLNHRRKPRQRRGPEYTW